MNYIVIASGTIKEYDYFARLLGLADKIVAADGGAGHLRRMNIVPDIAIGDLDSMDKETRTFLEQNKIPLITHPVDKDATDTDLAVQWAMENNAGSITLLGVTGTRMDHTLANIFLLEKITRAGIVCKILDDNNEIYLLIDKVEISGKPGEYLSIIPLTRSIGGVTITGVDFPLENHEIPMGSSLGISNRFTGGQAHVSIKNGMAIVTKSKDF
ncbi:MAG: thiamine diphosphokinase [Desulfobacterium sp.]|nr:thiamine diphosphokinase [Desulfobacterium sp.]